MLVIPQGGARLMLAQLLALPVQWFSLFQNDVLLNQATVFSDFVEATFSGYVQQFMAATWSPTFTFEGKAKSLATQRTFTHDGGGVANQIWGYYISNNTDLYWAEKFPGGPVTMTAGAPPLIVIPALTYISELLAV